MTARVETPSYAPGPAEQTFPRLTEEQIARVATRGRRRRVEAGEVLIPSGKPTTLFFVALTASIEVVRHGDLGDSLFRVIAPGEFTGEMSILSSRRMITTLWVHAPGDVHDIQRYVHVALVQTH